MALLVAALRIASPTSSRRVWQATQGDAGLRRILRQGKVPKTAGEGAGELLRPVRPALDNNQRRTTRRPVRGRRRSVRPLPSGNDRRAPGANRNAPRDAWASSVRSTRPAVAPSGAQETWRADEMLEHVLALFSTFGIIIQRWGPKVSKGRSESPLVAPAGAKSHCPRLLTSPHPSHYRMVI